MADEKAKEDATEVIEPEEKELVVTEGVGTNVLTSGLAQLKPLNKDMSLEERRNTIRETLKEAVSIPDKLDVMSGEMLYEVKENEYWKAWYVDDPETGESRPYSTFAEYSQTELDINKRKAYYLCDIYAKFVVELGLDKEILKQLQWSKAKELVPVINADNWTELLDKLKGMSVKQVQDMVREMAGKPPREEGATDGKDEFVRISFMLTKDQSDNVKSALEVAKSMSGSDKPGNQLDMICLDFAAGAVDSGLDGALTKLNTVIKHVERAFGVKLDIKEVDSERYAATEAATEEAPA